MSTRRYSYQHKRLYWTSYRDPEARKGRSGRPYRRFRGKVLAAAVPICCRCGGPIDKTLPWRDPWSATVDHLDALAEGGEPLDEMTSAPAHRICNLSHQPGKRSHLAHAPRSRAVADRRW